MTIYSLDILLSQLEPVCCSMSSSNCCFLARIQVSQEAGQVVWYSHLFQNFPLHSWLQIPRFPWPRSGFIICWHDSQNLGKHFTHDSSVNTAGGYTSEPARERDPEAEMWGGSRPKHACQGSKTSCNNNTQSITRQECSLSLWRQEFLLGFYWLQETQVQSLIWEVPWKRKW